MVPGTTCTAPAPDAADIDLCADIPLKASCDGGSCKCDEGYAVSPRGTSCVCAPGYSLCESEDGCELGQ